MTRCMSDLSSYARFGVGVVPDAVLTLEERDARICITQYGGNIVMRTTALGISLIEHDKEERHAKNEPRDAAV
jgi:hypothetical protein